MISSILAWMLTIIFQIIAIGVMIRFGIVSYEYGSIQIVAFVWGMIATFAPRTIDFNQKGE